MRLSDRMWFNRYLENGVSTDNITYQWIPTKAKKVMKRDKFEVATVVFPAIVLMLLAVLFVNNFDLIVSGFLSCLEVFK